MQMHARKTIHKARIQLKALTMMKGTDINANKQVLNKNANAIETLLYASRCCSEVQRQARTPLICSS